MTGTRKRCDIEPIGERDLINYSVYKQDGSIDRGGGTGVKAYPWELSAAGNGYVHNSLLISDQRDNLNIPVQQQQIDLSWICLMIIPFGVSFIC